MIETAIVAFVALAAIGALVVGHRVSSRQMRDELTANRLERAELMQRIQAPEHAVAQHAMASTPYVPELDFDPEALIEKEWAESPESLVPYDDDLFFGGAVEGER